MRKGCGAELCSKIQGNRTMRSDPRLRSCFFVSADSLRILAQCTRTELPQIITTLDRHQYVEGTSRGDNWVVAGLANCQRAVCRVAGARGFASTENYGSIGPRSRRDIVR